MTAAAAGGSQRRRRQHLAQQRHGPRTAEPASRYALEVLTGAWFRHRREFAKELRECAAACPPTAVAVGATTGPSSRRRVPELPAAGSRPRALPGAVTRHVPAGRSHRALQAQMDSTTLRAHGVR